MPLSLAKTGEPISIKRLGGREKTVRYLESLGFVVGGSVIVVSQNNGDLIVNVKDARVALSREMANRIIV